MGPQNSGKNDSKEKDNDDPNILECHVVVENLASTSDNIIFLNSLCGEGKLKHIFKCKSKRCMLKDCFKTKDKVVSTSTKRVHDCVVPDGSIYIDCHASNVIYLITCNRCFLQYVGETCQRLNERFNWHRSGFKHPEKYGFCHILSDHFHKGVCKDASYSVQILEKLEGNGRTERNALDPSVTSLRKKRELFWIHQLRTLYPYGLNDRIGDEYKNDETHCLVGKRFPPLSRNNPRIGRGLSHNNSFSLEPSIFIKNLKHKLSNDLVNTPNFVRVTLLKFKKTILKKIATLLHDELTIPENEIYQQWFLAALDIIECKLYKPPVPKAKKKIPKNILKVAFDSKAVEMINLPRIMNSSEVRNCIPNNLNSFESPTIVYTLNDSIQSKIFNHNHFVNNININSFLNNNAIYPCSCNGSPFVDRHHGHILTGDLRIVKNNKLRKLIIKGPKYRENKGISWNKTKSSIKNSINDYIKAWCDKNGCNEQLFHQWKHKVLELVDIQIQQLSIRIGSYFDQSILKDRSVSSCLQNLHNNYVVVPIDKATGNVAFVCQRFYALVIVNELGLNPQHASPTYNLSSKSENDIINNHTNFIRNKFNMKVQEDNKRLPRIYWLPKLHKNPSKFRFIIAAPKCSIKPLATSITLALKLLYKQIESYNDRSSYFSGVKTFWPILNNSPVIKAIKQLNERKKAYSISTFDFATLYTNIPHGKLKTVLREIINFCFKGGDKKYIEVNKYGAKWVSSRHASNVTFDKRSLKLAINYLLDNCYFNIGDIVLRQVVGIPMGSDPAPFMANLFLYFYENQYVRDLKKQNLRLARRFSNTFRYIDDLCAINDNGEFERTFRNIYPRELELKKENSIDSSATFLDLSIEINEGKFSTHIYDKRDSFPFSITRMPYKDSNIPSRMFYGCIGAEILRIARTTTNKNNFIEHVNILLRRMKSQGSSPIFVQRMLKRIYGRHSSNFRMISDTSSSFVDLFRF